MKKVLFGCLFVLVLMAVGGVALYYMVIKPTVGEYVEGVLQMSEVAELNDRVENKTPYTPPAGGVLSADQVERFVAVQQHMQKELGIRLDELEAKYDQIQQQIDQQGREATLSEVFNAFRDMTGLLVDAKRIQVEALNREGFSLEEYEWVRNEVYRAAGVAVPGVEFGDLAAALQEGGEATDGMAQAWQDAGAIPQENLERVEPYLELLRETAGLAWFGL